MKTLFTLFCTCLFVAGSAEAQSYIDWELPVEVNSSVDGQRPRIALLEDNTPVVIWYINGVTDKDLYMSRWNGTGFDAPVQMNDSPLLVYDWGGAEVSADGNDVYVVYKESNVSVGRVYLRHSSDGGQSWQPKMMIEDAAGELAMYPNVAAFSDDRVIVSYMTHEGGGANPQYIVKSSSDNGLSFSGSVPVSENLGDEACYCCPSALAANDTYEVLQFRNDVNNVRDMKLGISTNQSASYDSIISMDDHNWVINACPSTGGDVGLNGSTLYGTYMSEGSGDQMIYLTQDDLTDGNNYSVVDAVSDFTWSGMNHPRLANRGDTVVLVWEQNLAGSTEVWYNFNVNGINGWISGGAQPVNGHTFVQFKPDVAIGSDGTVHLVYEDLDAERILYTTGTVNALSLPEANLESFSVYPNPAQNVIEISGVNEGVTLKLTDLQGKDVQLISGKSVDVSQVAPGIYFLRAPGYVSQKVIIE